MYTLMATTTTAHTHATRMRNQLYPSVGMTATARARVAGSFKDAGMRGRRRRGGRALRDADDTARLERRFATCARGALACDPA